MFHDQCIFPAIGDSVVGWPPSNNLKTICFIKLARRIIAGADFETQRFDGDFRKAFHEMLK